MVVPFIIGSYADRRKPPLIAVGRVLRLWVGYRWSKNGHLETFACPSITFRKSDHHALRRSRRTLTAKGTDKARYVPAGRDKHDEPSLWYHSHC